jgi:hypothetical protein
MELTGHNSKGAVAFWLLIAVITSGTKVIL